MLFNHKDEVTHQLKNIVTQDNGGVKIDNAEKLRGDVLDQLILNAVLNPSAEIKGLSRFLIKSAAQELGIVTSSIQGLYDARGRGAATRAARAATAIAATTATTWAWLWLWVI